MQVVVVVATQHRLSLLRLAVQVVAVMVQTMTLCQRLLERLTLVVVEVVLLMDRVVVLMQQQQAALALLSSRSQLQKQQRSLAVSRKQAQQLAATRFTR